MWGYAAVTMAIERDDSGELLVLRRKPKITGWLSLGWRVIAMAFLLGLLILIHWIERDGLKDNYDGVVSFLDVIYFTMISATTTGYGDIVPVTDRTRLFDAIIVTPIRILFLLILAGSAYAFVARRSWERFIMKRIQRSLCDHTIIAGFGTKNSRAVKELIDLGSEPEDIVVIDTSEERLQKAKSMGCTVLKGDATRDAVLQSVHVDRAKLRLAAEPMLDQVLAWAAINSGSRNLAGLGAHGRPAGRRDSPRFPAIMLDGSKTSRAGRAVDAIPARPVRASTARPAPAFEGAARRAGAAAFHRPHGHGVRRRPRRSRKRAGSRMGCSTAPASPT
jgi:voltage-gated potassium channel Kch